ncbi:MAG: 2-oxo acid dehydrogenase subunit E2 [Chloroflexi bacterium]|nr:2-oxo acid dehydrogenase subunit E2 [Chloroflexota bacterium]
MPAEVVMPRLSDTMTEGKVLKWRKREGEPIKRGEIIAEIETDKAAMELESFDSGTVDKILVAEGKMVPVGEPIALLKTTEEAGVMAGSPERKDMAPAPSPKEYAPPSPAVAPARLEEERVKASPLARRIAEERGIDLAQVTGTGPEGRVTKEDVLAFIRQMEEGRRVTPARAEAPAPTEEAEMVQLNRMQATIAKRMSEAKTTVPHFYVTSEIDMSEAAKFVEDARAIGDEGQEIGYNELVVKASALALKRFPRVNASYHDSRLQMNKRINIGIAVSLPDGLVVPVVHDCDRKGLRQIAVEAQQVIERARTGRVLPGDYEGATFAVSNLGMFDVDEFAAIINPPESAILAVGTVKSVPVARDGQIAIAKLMKVTLSCDHRVFYGAQAAQFLQELKRMLENPLSLVL